MLLKTVLTYLVPYFMATYGAMSGARVRGGGIAKGDRR